MQDNKPVIRINSYKLNKKQLEFLLIKALGESKRLSKGKTIKNITSQGAMNRMSDFIAKFWEESTRLKNEKHSDRLKQFFEKKEFANKSFNEVLTDFKYYPAFTEHNKVVPMRSKVKINGKTFDVDAAILKDTLTGEDIKRKFIHRVYLGDLNIIDGNKPGVSDVLNDLFKEGKTISKMLMKLAGYDGFKLGSTYYLTNDETDSFFDLSSKKLEAIWKKAKK